MAVDGNFSLEQLLAGRPNSAQGRGGGSAGPAIQDMSMHLQTSTETTKAMNDLFPHSEIEVVAKSGISRTEIRSNRAALQEGVDFSFVKNRAMWSDKGIEGLCAKLCIPPLALGDTTKKTAAEKTLLFWRQTRNRHIIEAFLPDTDPRERQNVLRVRVKDDANFRRIDRTGKPMTLRAFHVQADLYELIGHCPRRPGCW